MRALAPALALAILGTAACSAYDEDIGPTPYLCSDSADPPCPEGYACQDDITTGERVCVGQGGMLSSNFDCADDSSVEPNNMLDVAVATGLDAMKTYAKDGLSICPAGDKDVFAITISAQNKSITLEAEFTANGATLVASILNAGGIPIETSQPVSGEPTKIRAVVANLPAGQYYAQVAASVGGALTLNNYKVSLDISP